MNALIILAHGSRRQESNQEIIALAQRVKMHANNQFKIVEHAYLEIANPDLLQCIDKTIKDGAIDITVLPYFLNSGNHVIRDIPEIVETAKHQHTNCEFRISAFIGMHAGMPELVLKQASVIK